MKHLVQILIVGFFSIATILGAFCTDDNQGVQLIYEKGKVVKALEDRNGDGRPDATYYFVKEKKTRGEAASRFDGKIDTWYFYNDAGILWQVQRDSNGDLKPDQFETMIKGRSLILKELDRNFDGRIDQRKTVTWSSERLRVPGQVPIPGFITLTNEEDNNFDGKVDVYTERGNKSLFKEKIGKPIEIRPVPASEEDFVKKQTAKSPSTLAEREEQKIRQLNEQHGITG